MSLFKRCSNCGIVKNKSDYHTANQRSDGVAVYCKECSSKKAKIYYIKNIVEKQCLHCNSFFLGSFNKNYCSDICSHSMLKKGIDGYKKCLYCNNLFPFRNSLKIRGQGKIRHKDSIFCSIKCSNTHRNKSEKMRQAGRNRSGEKCPAWRGGVSKINKVVRTMEESKQWRIKIFEKDNYTCQICHQRGNKLHADHIVSLSEMIYSNNIRTKSDAEKLKCLWDINNGRTLCVECHKKTDNYCGKGLKRTYNLLGKP